jgi:hypothetical protein
MFQEALIEARGYGTDRTGDVRNSAPIASTVGAPLDKSGNRDR